MRLRFRALVFLQVMLLLLVLFGIAASVFTTDQIAVPLVLSAIVLLQVLGLVHFVESHVAALEEFFAAINFDDFTQRFVTDDVDAELKQAFNRVIERFRDARADREVQANYLDAVVRHIPIPLLAVREDDSLRLVNKPARQLTGIAGLHHLDELTDLGANLPDEMRSIAVGQQRLLQANIRDVPVELRVSVSEIRIGGSVERLYSMENLSGELTARESSAWRNLIRVLTHEIMNSLTPISSLAQTSAGLLDKPSAANEVRDAIETIARRSDGLMQFVARYREILKVPLPSPTDVSIDTAVSDVCNLLADKLEPIDVEVDIQPRNLAVHADSALFDQLLLNIVKNAAEAFANSERPRIRVLAKLEFGRVVLRIADNGPGFDDEVADQLFVPFFTTKRDGSGIGLSLCRQIMTAHGGEIAIRRDGQWTVASLVF